MLSNFLIGAAGSLVASGIFLLFLFYGLRPKVRISPSIAKRTKDNGSSAYVFKIVNETAYPIVDVRVEIVLYTPRNIPNGQINDSVSLARHDRFELDSGSKPVKPYENEAWYTYEGLEDRWNDDSQYVVFRVMARHSMSQFSRVFTQTYYRKGACIKRGQFANGDSFDVVAEG